MSCQRNEQIFLDYPKFLKVVRKIFEKYRNNKVIIVKYFHHIINYENQNEVKQLKY